MRRHFVVLLVGLARGDRDGALAQPFDQPHQAGLLCLDVAPCVRHADARPAAGECRSGSRHRATDRARAGAATAKAWASLSVPRAWRRGSSPRSFRLSTAARIRASVAGVEREAAVTDDALAVTGGVARSPAVQQLHLEPAMARNFHQPVDAVGPAGLRLGQVAASLDDAQRGLAGRVPGPRRGCDGG